MTNHTSTLRLGRKGRLGNLGSLTAAVAAAVLGFAGDANACGGLFCSSAAPVNQAAERIIFAFDKEEGEVNTVVEIRYEGPADRFAWLLPVPGTPDVGVSSSVLLDALQARTNPTYGVQRRWPNGGDCATQRGIPVAASSPADSNFAGGGQVEVLDSGNVGPYDYETIRVREGDADEADAAVQWLAENNYDLGALGADVLRPYLQGGMNLLAVRLSKGTDAGAIRPLKLRYDSQRPMIPIRPTAVAANSEMPVMVFVLGEGRAAPTNYRSLVLNEALIDWFNPNASYNAVVEAAANEVEDDSGLMGHGFVTELAEPTSRQSLAEALYPEGAALQFRRAAEAQTDAGLISLALQTLGSRGGFVSPFSVPSGPLFEGLTEVLRQHVPVPEGVSEEDFLLSIECYLPGQEGEGERFYCDGERAPEQRVDLSGFDRTRFLQDIEELVIEPVEQTARLFNDHRYLTRLYTTLSPEEMTLDPEFDLNPDLADVSAQHTLTLEYQAGGCAFSVNGPWRAELQGKTIAGEGLQWPFALGQESAAGIPVNLQVLSFTPSGPLAVEVDNSRIIEAAVGAPPLDSGGCSVRAAGSQSSGAAGLGALGALALAGLARGRRRARA